MRAALATGRWPVCVVALTALVGCRQVLGLEEREVELPAETKGTPLYDASCMACLETECAVELAACRDDPECAGALESVRDCVDPACWAAAFAPFNGLTGPPGWPLYIPRMVGANTVDACMTNWCEGECRVGTNFDCTGHYSWRTMREQAGPFPVEVDVRVGLVPLAGARVRACGQDGSCTVPQDEATTGADGLAQLVVQGDLVGWYGSFQTDPPEADTTGLLKEDDFSATPMFEFEAKLNVWSMGTAMDAEDLLDDYFESVRGYDATLGYLVLAVNDCHVFPTLQPILDVTITPADSSETVYLPDLTGSSVWQAMTAWLLPERTTITVHDKRTGKEVVSFTYEQRAGTVSVVRLLPAAYVD